MQKNIPQVIGLGASYAGLRQVAKWLAEHPAIADTIPAGNFFNTSAYEKKSIEDYRHIFDTVGNQHHVKIDCTPGYLFDPKAAERIAQHLPDAKLFVILRHPVLRALSEYEARKKFDEDATRQSASHYLATHVEVQQNGYYAEQLGRYFGYYSPLSLFVLVYEELVASPLTVMQQLYKFLEIDAEFIPKELAAFAPPVEEPKHPSLLYRLKRLIKNTYKRLRPQSVPVLFSADEALRPLLTEDEWQLFITHVRPDIDQLSYLLNRDMAAVWGLKED